MSRSSHLTIEVHPFLSFLSEIEQNDDNDNEVNNDNDNDNNTTGRIT